MLVACAMDMVWFRGEGGGPVLERRCFDCIERCRDGSYTELKYKDDNPSLWVIFSFLHHLILVFIS